MQMTAEWRSQLPLVPSRERERESPFFQWNVYVGLIKEYGLLVLDFCMLMVVLSPLVLHLNEQGGGCEVHGSPQQAARVTLTDDVSIPAASQVTVKGEVTVRNVIIIQVCRHWATPSWEQGGGPCWQHVCEPWQTEETTCQSNESNSWGIVLRIGTAVLWDTCTRSRSSPVCVLDKSGNKAVEISAVPTAQPVQDLNIPDWPQLLQNLYHTSFRTWMTPNRLSFMRYLKSMWTCLLHPQMILARPM